MDIIIETLSITVSLVVLFLIPVGVFTLIYLIKRNGLHVTVNCWFCNGWTRVLYSERNSFCCPFCLQYNGFNEDGGYNKLIEAQFDTSFNNHYKTVEKTGTSPNGLCTYCNYNQQLKVRQLANFVPLQEKNYDAEVEHYQAQLEKSYKLCKKCEKVLKKTIGKQHALIFGNRIRDLQKKGLSTQKSTGFSIKYIHFIRYFLVLLLLIILCHALNGKLNLKNMLKKYLPETFASYMLVLNDWWLIISDNKETIIRNMCNKFNLPLTPRLKDVIIKNNILPITCFGLLLEVLLLIWQPKSILWKANEFLGWIVLIITSSNLYKNEYFTYVNSLQIISATAIIYSLLASSKPLRKRLSRKSKFSFRKLNMKVNEDCSSDEEFSEETSFHSNKSWKSCKESYDFKKFHQSEKLNGLHNTANLNSTFTTARSTKSSSIPNTSYKEEQSTCSNNDLHHSLDNLHLTNLNFKRQICTSPTVFSVSSVNRSILSPPKLKNITQNSWTAGGFWKNSVPTFPTATDCANLSRSSSQSSGFMSSNEPAHPSAFSSLPASREPSPHGEFERTSLLSEPVYRFTSINSSVNSVQPKLDFSWNTSHLQKPCLPKMNQLYYKAENVFYPVLNQNMLLLQGSGVPKFNFEGSFSNLSLGNLNTTTNGIKSPVLFGEKPVISGLFKNLSGLNTRSCTFRAPNC